jgi:hypothetical protein
MRAFLWLVALVVIGGAAAYGVPLAAESASTTCNALEKRFIALNAPARGGSGPERDLANLGRAFLGNLQNVSNGSFATEYAIREYPNLPPGFGCAVLYWRTFLPGGKTPVAPRRA